jgi:hypothetical protein
MRAVQLDPIAVPFRDDAVKIVGVCWSDSCATVIDLISKRSGRRARVEFQDDAGLRILGELDLASMWMGGDPTALEETWMFEVRAGGWLELESTREDFYTKHESPVREFLIAGYQECVSVFSRLGPTVVEVVGASDV